MVACVINNEFMYIELVNEENSHKMKIYAPISRNKIEESAEVTRDREKIINFFKLKLKNAAGEKVFIIFVFPWRQLSVVVVTSFGVSLLSNFLVHKRRAAAVSSGQRIAE